MIKQIAVILVVVLITMLMVHRVLAEEIPAGQGGTVVDEFFNAKGKFIGFVKYFGDHEWRFYDNTGNVIRNFDDREVPTLCFVTKPSPSCNRRAVIEFIERGDGSK